MFGKSVILLFMIVNSDSYTTLILLLMIVISCYGPTNKARGSCVTAVVNLSCRVLSAVNGLAYKRLGFGHRLARSLLQTSALPE